MLRLGRWVIFAAVLTAVLRLPIRAEDTQVATWRQNATAGDAQAETNLGRAYSYGTNGVGVDYGQAMLWLQKAAAQNNALAASEIGWLYQSGHGVPRDPAHAFQWFKKGAEGGDAYGEMSLGYCYQDAIGVAKDPAQAVAWFTQSARQGNDQAMTALGGALEQGIGVTKDPRLAYTYYLRAAYDNFGWAQYNVGRCYYGGIFVAKDPVEAYRWFLLAAKQEYNPPSELQMLYYFATTLTPAQLGQAQTLIRNWEKERSGDIQPSSVAINYASNQRALIPLQDVYNELVVTATLDGHPNLNFMIDTGASMTCIDETTAAALGLPSDSLFHPTYGIGQNPILMSESKGLDLQLSGIKFSGINVCHTSTSDWDSHLGMHIDGVLGADLLRHEVIKIDYIRRTVDFIDPSPFKSSDEIGTSLPLVFHGQCGFVKGIVTNNTASSPLTDFALDTGDTASLDLSLNFVNANRYLHLDSGFSSLQGGIGGTLATHTMKASQLKLDGITIDNPAVDIAAANQGFLSNFAGLVGNEILRRFDVTIDYPENKVFLKPNIHVNDPFIYANSGLDVRATGPDLKTYVVHDVRADTAGSHAGFQIGDILTQYDDISLSTRSMSQARMLFCLGGKHHVIVMRNGKPVTLDYVRDDIPVLKTGT